MNENCTLTESDDMQCVDTTICMENEEEDKVCQCPDFTTIWDVGYERCINSEGKTTATIVILVLLLDLQMNILLVYKYVCIIIIRKHKIEFGISCC